MAGGSGARLYPITKGVSKQLLLVYDKPMIYYPLSTRLMAGIREILVITTAQAFIVGADHIGTEPVALILGDNIFYGPGVCTSLSRFRNIQGGAIFAYWVANPSAYGVVEFAADGTALSLEEDNQGRLAVEVLPRGAAWLDTGTFDSLLDASDFVRTIEARQGLKVSCPEEAAWRVGLIDDDQLAERAHALLKSGCGGYLLELLERH